MKAFTCIATIVALLSMEAGATARAERLVVMSAVGMREVLVHVAPDFERATGHQLAITFDSGAAIAKRIQGGDHADVVLVPHDMARQLVNAGRGVAGSLTELAASRVGVAVRAGTPRPDIASPEALKRTLLAAKSIARPDPAQGGSSGIHIQRVLERLGIAEAVAVKTILSSRPGMQDEMPARRVADGTADIALHQVQELLAVPGVVLVGPLPGDLDGRFLFSAIVVSGSRAMSAAKALIAFLSSPETAAVMKAKGMEPALRLR